MATVVTQVLAARVPVLTLENDPDAAAEAFCLAAEELDEDVSTVILGCAGAVTISDCSDTVFAQKSPRRPYFCCPPRTRHFCLGPQRTCDGQKKCSV